MTHKKALKKLMSIGMDRNTANRRLRMAYYSSLTNAQIVAWQMTADPVYRFAVDFKRNWCELFDKLVCGKNGKEELSDEKNS